MPYHLPSKEILTTRFNTALIINTLLQINNLPDTRKLASKDYSKSSFNVKEMSLLDTTSLRMPLPFNSAHQKILLGLE